MSTVNERIAFLVDSMCNGNKSDFARKIGITPGYSAQLYLSIRQPSNRTLNDICREFNVNPVWLREGIGEPLTPHSQPEMKDRISYIIQSKKITKTSFAQQLNLSQSFVSQLCSGASRPSERTIADICRVYGVDNDWLHTGEGDPFLSSSDTMHERIKELRRMLDITQNDFAEDIGLSRNYVAMIEIGQRTPSERTLKDICRVYGVNTEWLRTGEGEVFLPESRTDELATIFEGVRLSDNPKAKLLKALDKIPEEVFLIFLNELSNALEAE